MDSSLLDSETGGTEALLEKLLLESGMDPSQLAEMAMGGGGEGQSVGGVPVTRITPTPGFCVKLKSAGDEKIFFNICQSDKVPPTKDLTDDELLKILESDDMSQFRIPMCIGEPHAELDKSGGGCTVYDVIVHTDFIKKLQTNNLFQTFFLSIVCEGIEEKYEAELKREWVVLKNRRCVGQLQEQTVRTKSKPVIMDMDHRTEAATSSEMDNQWKTSGLIQEVKESERKEIEKKQAPEPKFSLVKEPAEGHPEFLVAEIHLPLVKTAQAVSLDVGEDRILLETRSNVYHLDIYLPYNLVQEEVGAQFDRSTKILTLTMPVQAES
ncbi:PIH1 domain-containing protein 1-like [Babylonia areolata]|uniref:PIH1 domain-containing protein 1-like n=1 Tax=Babylonia areolata TaxID=304850 RepID=UPI003FD179C8